MAKRKPVFSMYLEAGAFFCKTAFVTPPKCVLRALNTIFYISAIFSTRQDRKYSDPGIHTITLGSSWEYSTCCSGKSWDIPIGIALSLYWPAICGLGVARDITTARLGIVWDIPFGMVPSTVFLRYIRPGISRPFAWGKDEKSRSGLCFLQC